MVWYRIRVGDLLYNVKEETIMKNKIILMLLSFSLAVQAYGQDVLSGIVVDNLGKPVASAKVSLEKSVVSTLTDENGMFSITAPKGTSLFIETPTNAAKSILVGDEKKIRVVMDYASKPVSVNPLIAGQTNEESTSAVATVGSEELMKSSALSVRNALFGKVLGLTALQGSGSIWEEKAALSIRGAQSLSGSGILVLVDGFERPIDDLTTEEVESVSILKDAAAVALYGHKGINGAILVKTKRGMYDAMNIDISYDHGFSKAVRLPKFVDAYTYAQAMNEAYRNDGKGARYSQYELDAFRSGDLPYLYPNVDWMDETIGDMGHSNIYNISFQGGGKKMRYYTMLNLENNSGFFKNTDTNEGYSNQNEYSKGNIRANLDITISKSTNLQVNLLGILTEYNHSQPNKIMDNLYTLPAAAYPIKTEDGIWGGDLTWPGINPVANLQAKGYDRSHARTLMADMTLRQELDFITKGLGASLRLGYDNATTYWEVRSKSYKYASDVLNFENGIPANITRIAGGQDNELTFTKNMNGPMYRRFNFIAQLDYKKDFAKSKLYTTLMWHFNHSVQQNRHNTLNRVDFSSYTHYGILDRYFVDLALVGSGSNRLPANYKFTFSPTLSAAWVLSKENFLSDVSWISLLKLRASAGILHSDYVPEWNITSDAFGGGGNYFFGDNFNNYAGVAEGRLPTMNFKHERALKYNVGIDATLFGGLTFMGDVYFQRRDQIMVGQGGRTSTVLGLNPAYVPMGRVDSKGVELGLSYEKAHGDFLITGGARFTLAKNKIVEKLEQPMAEEYLRTTGLPMGQPFGLEAIGFFKDDAGIASSPKQLFSEVAPGDIKYKDQNKDGFIDDNDKVAMGYNMSTPEAYFAFNAGVEYKGIGIDFLFQGVARYSAWLNAKSVYRPLAGNCTISEHYYANRWTPETPDALYPRLTSDSNPNNDQSSDLWLADASFLKLRHCEVYFKLPKAWINKIKMKTAKLYVRGMDLFSIDKMDIFDPEVVGVSYPADRSVHVGVRVGF